MCIPAVPALLTALKVGVGATAAGATAGAATAGVAAGLPAFLQTAGTIASVAGPLVKGVQVRNAAKASAAAIAEQRRQEAILNSIEDQRVRAEFARDMARQRAQLADRGVSLDSPTAVFLGQTAAREMAFASGSVRQTGQARQTELTTSAQLQQAQGTQALFNGGFSAAGEFISAAPKLWPELLE